MPSNIIFISNQWKGKEEDKTDPANLVNLIHITTNFRTLAP
jgi:hypothetical protein